MKMINIAISIFKNICNAVADTMFPKHCILCGKMIPVCRQRCICDNCVPKVRQCETVLTDNDCGCCEVISPFEYSGHTRDAMLRFKFKGIKYIGHTFADYMADMIADRSFLKEDCIMVSMPIHVQRDRDYNQSDIMAQRIADRLGMSYYKDIVCKVKPISRISGMTLKDKRFFVEGSFHFNCCYNLTGKTVVVVDDIYTSGTTMAEFAKLLKMNGASKVYALTACMTKAER